MKQSLGLPLIVIFLLFLITECDRPESPSPELQEFGYLSLSVALQIEDQPASGYKNKFGNEKLKERDFGLGV